MPHITVHSRAKGPRVVRPIGKPAKTLHPGHQITAEVDEAHLAYLRKVDGLQVERHADEAPAQAPAPPPAEFDPELIEAMTDDELRAFIAKRDGRQPHPNTGRDKLLAKARGDD